MTPPVVLTVAAHDPLGGSGIAADLTTFAAFGGHGVVAVTAVTAQRFEAVERVEAVAADLLRDQLDGIIDDCRPDAMKIGLVLDARQVEVIAERIADGRLPRPVVDPVMVDGRGRRFVTERLRDSVAWSIAPTGAIGPVAHRIDSAGQGMWAQASP